MTNLQTMLRPALSTLVTAAVLAGAWPTLTSAQVVSSSPQNAALAGNGTMISRGARALEVNPALLAAPDRPSLSLTLPALSAGAQTDPLQFSDIKPYQNTVVPHSVAEEWLDRITKAGGLHTTATANTGIVGLSIGPVAVGVGAVGAANFTLPPELAELLLFGNAGRNGEPRDMTFTGGGGRSWGAGVISAGFGMNVWQSLAVGVTGKFVASPGMAEMVAPKGHVTANPMGTDLTVPFIVFDETKQGTLGATGYGFDVGAAWSAGPLAVGVTVHDVMNTFQYRLESARVRRATALVTADSTGGGMDDEMMLDDPRVDAATRARAKEIVDQARFTPTFRVSGALTPISWLTVTSDVVTHNGSADALTSLPKFSVGVGAEARIIPFLPLRGGVRVGDGYTTLRAGAGLRLLGIRVDGAVGTTRGAGAGLDAAVGVTLMGGKF